MGFFDPLRRAVGIATDAEIASARADKERMRANPKIPPIALEPLLEVFFSISTPKKPTPNQKSFETRISSGRRTLICAGRQLPGLADNMGMS